MFGLSKHDDEDTKQDQTYSNDLASSLNTNMGSQPAPQPAYQNAPAPAAPTPQPINDISFSSPYSMHHPVMNTVSTNDTDDKDDEVSIPVQSAPVPTPSPMYSEPEAKEEEPAKAEEPVVVTTPELEDEPKEPIDLDHVKPDDVDRQLPAGDKESEIEEPETTSAMPTTTSTVNNDLLDIKREAMEALAPLVEHLDQDPEEKFATAMSIVRETGGSETIHHAYEAAKNIPDDAARAMALLEVVKEIEKLTSA